MVSKIMQKKLSIFIYNDFRLFLKDTYLARKETDRKFSHRYIAQHVGATSSGWFSDIINGRITLTRQFIPALVKVFALRAKEADFFELLVGYGQAETLEEKNRFLQKIISFKDIEPLIVTKNQFDFYRNWYFTAIRELLLYIDFKGDVSVLVQKLSPAIKPAEARQAIETLLSIGLIKENEQGFLKPVEKTISKDSAFQTVHWRNFMVAMMQLAQESVDRHKAQERDISTVTVGLSASAYAVARQEIALLRKRLLALSEQDTQVDKVYQCNFQLFPLSQSLQDTP